MMRNGILTSTCANLVRLIWGGGGGARAIRGISSLAYIQQGKGGRAEETRRERGKLKPYLTHGKAKGDALSSLEWIFVTSPYILYFLTLHYMCTRVDLNSLSLTLYCVTVVYISACAASCCISCWCKWKSTFFPPTAASFLVVVFFLCPSHLCIISNFYFPHECHDSHLHHFYGPQKYVVINING